MELDVLKLISNKDNYDSYITYIKDYMLTSHCRNIVKDIPAYYDATGSTDIDWSDFSSWFCISQHPSWEKEKLEIYQAIFDRLATMSDPPPTHVIKHFLTMDYGTRIFEESSKIAEGVKKDLGQVEALLEEYKSKLDAEEAEEDSIITLADKDYILDTAMGKHGFKWSLPCLQKSLGDLSAGDLIMVVGRPDAGKTTLLAQEGMNIAVQSTPDTHVLWFNNEEQGSKVFLRCIQAALRKERKYIEAHWEDCIADFERMIGGSDKLVLYDSPGITIADIRRMIDRYPPAVVIIDKLSKVRIPRNRDELETVTVQHLAEFARSIAKQHCPVFFTEWADGSADGVKWIEQAQIYGSKTGLQGEADAIIAIGKSNDEMMKDRNKRYIHIPKNKLPGEDEYLRNAKHEVEIQPMIARFR